MYLQKPILIPFNHSLTSESRPKTIKRMNKKFGIVVRLNFLNIQNKRFFAIRNYTLKYQVPQVSLWKLIKVIGGSLRKHIDKFYTVSF